MEKSKFNTVQFKKDAIILKDKSGNLLIEYEEQINSIRAHMDHMNRTIVRKMFESIQIMSNHIKTTVATYGKGIQEVCRDIARAPVGSRVLSTNTVYQYLKTHIFMEELSKEFPPVYKRLMQKIDDGLVYFSTVKMISASSMSLEKKSEIIEMHMDGKDEYSSRKGLEISIKNLQTQNGIYSNNQWMNEEIVNAFIKQYVKNGEKVYAPFGTETFSEDLIIPHKSTQAKFKTDGFVDEIGNLLKDNSIDNILIQLPQVNMMKRSNQNMTTVSKFKECDIQSFDDAVDTMKFLALESKRILKPGGRIAIVSWNIYWGREPKIINKVLKDFNFETRKIIGNNFKWLNTASVFIRRKDVRWFQDQAYRVVHIGEKLIK